ncbi:DUF3967 domain-containing protein [Lentibacillus kapialis]
MEERDWRLMETLIEIQETKTLYRRKARSRFFHRLLKSEFRDS